MSLLISTVLSGSRNRLAPLPELPHVPPAGGAIGERLLTGIGAALDASVLRAMQWVVERALIPDPDNVSALRESARPMLDPALQREPARFFAFPEAAPERSVLRVRELRRLPGGRVCECRMQSAYEPRLVDEGDREHRVRRWRDACRVARRRVDLDPLEGCPERRSEGLESLRRAASVIGEPETEHAQAALIRSFRDHGQILSIQAEGGTATLPDWRWEDGLAYDGRDD